MIHTDDSFSDRVAARVAAIESRTDAELVVVAASRSRSYAHVPALGALAWSLLSAGVMLFAPWEVSPAVFVLEQVLGAGAVAWVCQRPRVLRWLTPELARRDAVARAAAAEFLLEAVHGTPARTGVLVYISALEERVEVLADLGVQGRVPRGELAAAAKALTPHSLEAFLEGLDVLGDSLARHIPHHPGSDATDLPNAPRIRP